MGQGIKGWLRRGEGKCGFYRGTWYALFVGEASKQSEKQIPRVFLLEAKLLPHIQFPVFYLFVSEFGFMGTDGNASVDCSYPYSFRFLFLFFLSSFPVILAVQHLPC